MNRMPGLLPLLALGTLLYDCPSRLRAECVSADSIEWIVASSDVVVRGTITEGVRLQYTSVDEVTVQVAETLKGAKQEKFSLVMPRTHLIGGDEPSRLAKSKKEVLFFLVKSEFAESGLALRPYTDMLDLMTKGSLRVPAMDFKVLTRPEDVLGTIRTAVAEQGQKKLRSTLFGVPADTEAHEALWRRSGVTLTVPVDGRLEKLAREWYKSKDLEYRLLGVQAFAEFKSEENIRLMKNLLRNPEYWEGTSNGRRYRYYPLRRAAYEALKGWGIEVQEPLIEEPLD
jgi:hypothetical protein